VIAAWSARYLDLKKPPAPIGAPEGIVRVSEGDPDSFIQDVQAGPKLHMLADEPEAVGGSGLGMTPYQFLAAGLGACTSMTIRMYARRKKIPLTHVSVDVTHDKVHASDCDTCYSENGKVALRERSRWKPRRLKTVSRQAVSLRFFFLQFCKVAAQIR